MSEALLIPNPKNLKSQTLNPKLQAKDIVTAMSEALTAKQWRTPLSFTIRGLAYMMRSKVIKGVDDLDLAKADLTSALLMDPGCSTARCARAYINLRSRDLASASLDIQYLDNDPRHRRDDATLELKGIATKVVMMYAVILRDIGTALHLNPAYAPLSTTSPNVAISHLLDEGALLKAARAAVGIPTTSTGASCVPPPSFPVNSRSCVNLLKIGPVRSKRVSRVPQPIVGGLPRLNDAIQARFSVSRRLIRLHN